MAMWLVADSLACREQYFGSHLSSYSYYLREAGEEVRSLCLNIGDGPWDVHEGERIGPADVVFALHRYDRCAEWAEVLPRAKFISQVAAICSPMPWDVRKPDGSPAYDLVISSIPKMVDEARAKGCRAEYMPLAFDARARVCGMGVKRDLDCIFIGSTGSNHRRRTELLRELSDVVTVLPPVYGRDYFKTLARAKVVLNVHAEWAQGAANAMRLFESAGLGALVISDGIRPDVPEWPLPFHMYGGSGARDLREMIRAFMDDPALLASVTEDGQGEVVLRHTYEARIPSLIELARSL